MSVLDLLDREDGIDHRLNGFVGQQWSYFARECVGNCDLLFHRSRAEYRTDDVETFAQDLIEIDVSLTAGNSTDENDPAPLPHCFETGGEIRTAIQIENNIKSA